MKIIGESYPIHDASAKATGRAVYAGDMQLHGMLHIAVLFSPIAHGYVRAIDASAALALPGVVDVLHCFNTTGNVYNRYRFMYGDTPEAQERVFNRHVRFVGDRVACVVAATARLARQALKLIKVEYEELPACFDANEARRTGVLANIHEQGAVYGDFEIEIGERPPLPADVSVTRTTSHLSRINHMTMEPHACVADYSRALDELTVWSPNQSVFGIRTSLGELFEMPYHKIRVVKTTMGGSFGAKQEWMLEPIAAAAALRVGRPVSLVYSRGEAMTSTINRCPLDGEMISTFTRDGRLQSIEADFTLDAGAYLGNSYDYAVAVAGKFFRFYAYPHVHYTTRAVCTNTPVSGAFRGWASPELAIVLEHNLNMAARDLGMDPLELRLKNAATPEDIDRKTGESLGEIRGRECLLRGRELFGWAERRDRIATYNAAQDRYRRGVGVACGGHVNGYYPRRQDFTGVGMRMTESGSVLVNVTLHDHGCGTVTAFRMMVAEALDIPMNMVSVREGDTAITPMDPGCFASRTIYVLGRAAVDCAERLRQQLVANAAELAGVAPEVLYTESGVVRSRADETYARTFAQVSVDSIRRLQREICVEHQYVNRSNPGVTAVHFAEVEVDTYTGMVRLVDYLAMQDIGRVINREICIGQVQGAVLMGAGAAIAEHNDVKANGNPTNSLKDYHLINAFEAPQIRVEFIEDGRTDGPFGAKSIGELCHVPVAPAVVGAVNDALQSDLCELPLIPDRILSYLAERGERVEAGISSQRQSCRAGG